jgi:hypothetical protein
VRGWADGNVAVPFPVADGTAQLPGLSSSPRVSGGRARKSTPGQYLICYTQEASKIDPRSSDLGGEGIACKSLFAGERRRSRED